MATVESVSTTSYTQATSTAITKPTGLAEGELMLAVISYDDDTQNISAPAGWTEIFDAINGDANQAVFTKTATSSDVSATSFTFSRTGTDWIFGSILRISGANQSVAIYDWDTFTNTGTPTFSGGVTPTVASSLLVMGISAKDGCADPSGTPSVATNNPTWTRRWDTFNGEATAANQRFVTCWTATRTETTATGNYSGSFATTGVSDGTGFILVVAPATSVEVSATVVTATVSPVAPAIALGVAVDVSAVSATTSINSASITAQTNPWTNQSKTGNDDWTNQALS